jgi:biotin transport system substrate-specific component
MPPIQAAAAMPRPRALLLLQALALSLVLALSAKASVPFWPVPMTLQTLAVLTMGALLGPRLAVAAFAVYLAEGAAGLAVFSGTPERGIGLAYMMGPTGGYLAGMALAAAIAGWAGQHLAGRLVPAALAMLAATAAVYACGAAWLAHFVGWPHVWALGVRPFLAGDAVKGAIVAGLIALRRRA